MKCVKFMNPVSFLTKTIHLINDNIDRNKSEIKWMWIWKGMNLELLYSICIDKNKIHVVSNAHYFSSFFNRVLALDHQNFVYAQYLVDFDQILYKHWYWQGVDLDD